MGTGSASGIGRSEQAATEAASGRGAGTGASAAPPSFGDRYWRRSEGWPAAPRAEPVAPGRAAPDGAGPESDEPEYRALADNLPSLCWIANADGYITWYNRRWHEYCGTTPQQMEGWGWQAVHDPAVLPEVMAGWTGSIASGEPFEMTFPLRGADGVFRPFLTRIVPLRDAAGTIRRWIGNNVEISRQSEVEQELRGSQAELEKLNRTLAEREAFVSGVLASSTDCIKVLDLDGRLTFMSEAGQRVMEVSDFNAVAGCPWPDFWAGTGNVEAVAAIEAARRGEARTFVGRANTFAGRPRWWHVAVSPIPGPDGRPERILSVSRDITELREREEERDRFVRLAENSQDFVAMAHRDGRLFFLNDAACRLVGLDRAAATGLAITDFVSPDEAERIAAEVLPAAASDGQWSGELHLRHSGTGELIPVLFSVFPIADGGGTVGGYGAVARDFRAHKAAEEQLRLLNGEMSHRLKNTLTVVQAIASQTFGGADRDAVAAFGRRIATLAGAHDVLLQRSWSGAGLRDVAAAALDSFDRGERLVLAGPELAIGPRATLALSLLLHELATNATKYGALSVPGGRVELGWSVFDGEDGPALRLRWAERGGPPAAAPTRRGFGSRIIRMGLSGAGGVDLQYGDEGLTAEMTASLDELRSA